MGQGCATVWRAPLFPVRGDYEALKPLKRLADTYHVSILAVHHLRKTGSSDVQDEIIGSTGVTGAVDGTMILKRDRGQYFVVSADSGHSQWRLS